MVNTVLNTLAQSTRANGGDNTLTLNGTFTGSATEVIREVRLTTFMTDIATASSVYIFPAAGGTLKQVTAVLNGDTSGGTNVTLTVSIDGTPVEGNTFRFEGDKVAGQKEVFIPTGLDTFNPLDDIQVATNGNTTGPASVTISFFWLPN